MEMTKATFRAFREECGYSQRDVAEQFDVSMLTVKRWERPDKTEPPLEACKWLEQRREELHEIVDIMTDNALNTLDETGTCEIAIRYYRTQEELDAARERDGMPPEKVGFVNAASRLTASIVEAHGYGVAFVYDMEIVEKLA